MIYGVFAYTFELSNAQHCNNKKLIAMLIFITPYPNHYGYAAFVCVLPAAPAVDDI